MRALFRFKHFQSRLLVFFLVPLLAVLAAVYLAVTSANTRNALAIITDDLELGAKNFLETLALRNDTLAIAGDALSYDYAIKEAYATEDPATILSAMVNLYDRLGLADFIVMVDDETSMIAADTLRPELVGTAPEWLPLIEQARALDQRGEFPEAADVVIVDGRPYHLTIIPFFSPVIVAWVGLGFEINQAFTQTFADSVATEVSVLFKDTVGNWQSNGSTLEESVQQQLVVEFAGLIAETGSTIQSLSGEEFVTLARPISADGSSVHVVLQRSLTKQLAPFEALRQVLFTIFALGLVVLVIGVLAISRKVTRPVLQLAGQARRIEGGDYDQTVNIPLQDEIGALAQAFNGMASGLAEKERVRNLLGKVVSPEVASELLRGDIELGGEEREVTVLFCDVRGFTSLCEGQAPRQILSLLNEYFSVITGVIETNGGVVDKYIGDAVMVLFGAPATQTDAPSHAIRAALGMLQALSGVNASFTARGLKPIAIGIGINTDKVVAGNMGSQSRLNYTVIGDGVNLASRLEGLTKRYGAAIIVSEQCALAAPGFIYRELDRVRVKGKQEPVRIFEPLYATDAAPVALKEELEHFQAFLHAYGEGRFAAALALLDACETASLLAALPGTTVLTTLYRDRLHALLQNPPPHWDGVHTFDEK